MAKVLKAAEMNKCIGCFTCMNICSIVNRQNHSITKSAIKVRTSGGMTGHFVAIVCLACHDPACMEACPSGALTKRPGGGVLLQEDKCIGCHKCEKACIMQAVFFDEEKQKPIICRHCGSCARFCPHHCLIMKEVGET